MVMGLVPGRTLRLSTLTMTSSRHEPLMGHDRTARAVGEVVGVLRDAEIGESTVLSA
jgi:hypothetical protein